MPSLPELVPEPDAVIGMAPEELGRILLRLAADPEQRGMFSRLGIAGDERLFRGDAGRPSYPQDRRRELRLAVGEAWHWLELSMLIMPAEGPNGDNGYRVLTRRGEEIAAGGNFASFRAASAFPKQLLHPSIAEEVWLALARGDFAVAVFRAFRAVEEAVRDACGFRAEDVGTDLVRRAFHAENGPLTKLDDPLAEREALAHLFAGAIGSYKNPHSHRTVAINDSRDAQEMAMLASHLLRIVDARRVV